MTQPLVGKQILIVEDELVFRSLLDSWLQSLGATTLLAGDGVDALEQMAGNQPDLIICDLAMPRMNGLALVEALRNQGMQTPVLVISATENMADIAKALRLGVQDVVLKPVKDFNRLRETIFACIYPNMFNSRVEEEERLFQDWDALVDNPQAAANLLKELQPPVQQVISGCRVNYRQLVAADASLAASRASLLPSINLTATGSIQDRTLSGLLDNPLQLWSAGGSILAPLLNRQALNAQVDISQSQRNQALYAYEKTVRNAFAEVNNSLDAITRYQEQLSELLAQQEVAQETLRIAQNRNRNGYSSYLDVLDAQRTLFSVQTSVVQVKNNLLLAQIDLYRALGGGWVSA